MFAVYQPEILALRHFTNAQGSLITTVRSLFILVALLTVNRVCARLGLRRTMTLGVLLIALSCFCFGAARAFWQYCAAAVFTGLGYCYGGMVPLSLLIGRWFRAAGIWPWGWPRRAAGRPASWPPPWWSGSLRAGGCRPPSGWRGPPWLSWPGWCGCWCAATRAQLGLEPLGGAAPDAHAPVSQRRSGPPAYLPAMAAGFLIGGMGGPGLFPPDGPLCHPGLRPPVPGGPGVRLWGGRLRGQGAVRADLRPLGFCGRGRLLLSVRAGGDAAVLPPRAGKSSGAGAGGWAVLPGAAHLRRVPLCVGAELAGPDDFPRAVQAINLAYAVGVILFGPVPGFWRTGRAAISRPISSLPLCSPWPSRWCAWPMPEKSG